MGDVGPRRSSRKRTTSSRLQDMHLLGIGAKQTKKRQADQLENTGQKACGKRTKPEKEWLAPQSNVAIKRGRKKRTNLSTVNTDTAEVDHQPMTCQDNFRKHLKEPSASDHDFHLRETGHQSNTEDHDEVKDETNIGTAEEVAFENEQIGKAIEQEMDLTEQDGQESKQTEQEGQVLEQIKHEGQELEQAEQVGQELEQAEQIGQELEQAEQIGQELEQAEQIGQELEQAEQVGQELEQAVQVGQELEQAVQVGQELEQAEQVGQELEQVEQVGQKLEQIEQVGQELEQAEQVGEEVEQAVQVGQELEQAVQVGEESVIRDTVVEKDTTGTHDTVTHDTGTHDTVTHDTVTHDTVTHDTGTHDTVTHDTVTHDTGTHDTVTHDTGTHDTGTHDTVTHDTVTHDTVTHDTVTHDTVTHDTVTHDTVTHDTGTHDTGKGASSKNSAKCVDRAIVMTVAQTKPVSNKSSNEESTENMETCAFVESGDILYLRNEGGHGANDAEMDGTFPADNNNDAHCESVTTYVDNEQDGVRIEAECNPHTTADNSSVDLGRTTESTDGLGQLPSVYVENNSTEGITVIGNDASGLLGLDSTTQLICDVAARLPVSQTLQLAGQSQGDETATVMSFDSNTTYVLKTDMGKSHANYESPSDGGECGSQADSVQPASGSDEDTVFFANETTPVSCDGMVTSVEVDTSPVCVVRLPSVNKDTNQSNGTPCSVVIDVVQLPSTQSPGVTYVNVSDTDVAASARVGDVGAGVGVGSIDTATGTHVDVVLVPAVASTDGLFRCDYCPYTTEKKANWYKHKVHHTGRRPYSCDKCPYSATTSSNLRRHQLIHAEVRSFQCSICEVKFRQKIHLERHVKYKHQEKSVECPHCDYHCANVTPDLKVHLQRRHQIGVDQPQLPLCCSDCSFTTFSRKDLKQHEKFHKSGPELKLYCEQCCFVTDSQSRLKRHLLTHTRERPFPCALCDYRATQKEHVVRHMKAKHNAEAPEGHHRRAHTSRESSSDGGHVAQVATTLGQSQHKRRTPLTDFCNKEKLFACNFCTMSFAKLINLYKHIRVQHGNTEADGQYACVVCEYRSASRNNLLVHMRKHNANAGGDPPAQCKLYSCVVCKFMHPKRQTLYNHMRKVHNMQIVVTRGNVHCLIDANDITDDNDSPATTASNADPEQALISVDESNATLLEMTSGSQTDATTPGGSYGSSEAINAVQKLQVLSQTDEPMPLDRVVLAEDLVVSTDQEEETVIDEDVAKATDIEVCSTELSQLSSGDYVEINGEMYKVEFSNPK